MSDELQEKPDRAAELLELRDQLDGVGRPSAVARRTFKHCTVLFLLPCVYLWAIGAPEIVLNGLIGIVVGGPVLCSLTVGRRRLQQQREGIERQIRRIERSIGRDAQPEPHLAP